MVNKRFVSKQEVEPDAWQWPVFAKSESEYENILTSIAPITVVPIVFPALALIYLLGFWLLYKFKKIDLKALRVVSVISGSLWFALAYLFGSKIFFSEIVSSIFYKLPSHNHFEIFALSIARQIFFVTTAMVFWIHYNRRLVDPNKVHHKVFERQRHERMRLLRRWVATIDIPEVLS